MDEGSEAGGAGPAEQPKIIIDSDWKAEAQAEKERLSQEAEERQDKSGAVGPDGLPPADFKGLLGALAVQALSYLGAFPDPQTGRAVVALDYAKHHIDLLEVLEKKTAGNLEKDEDEELTQILNELRMRFVQIAQAVAAQGEGGGAPNPGAPPPSDS